MLFSKTLTHSELSPCATCHLSVCACICVSVPRPRELTGVSGAPASSVTSPFPAAPFRYIGALGARVICDNIPGLANKQRQLCQRHPDIMQAIGEGTKEWIRECQHQFRHHRWNCSTLDRDHTVFGRVLLRSESTVCACVCVCVSVSRERSNPWT